MPKFDEVPVGRSAISFIDGWLMVKAPIDGRVVSLDRVPDQVFASGMLGSGIGIIPDEAHQRPALVRSPASGTVAVAFRTGHGYAIKADNGVEVLLHIGVDTVSMKGEGFEALVKAGDIVGVGEPLASVDFAEIIGAGLDPTVITLITNTRDLTSVTPVSTERVVAGETIMTVRP